MADDLAAQIRDWFEKKISKEWFEGAPEVEVDSEEILVTGILPKGDNSKNAKGKEKDELSRARVSEFRNNTREQRIEVASEAERLFNRKVSWAVRSGDTYVPFTGLGVPVMTRLRMRERSVLDTLVDSGVARSRSDALAWCARLVADKQKDWIEELRQAFQEVEKVRSKGPVESKNLRTI
jgi:hypothetical protein